MLLHTNFIADQLREKQRAARWLSLGLALFLAWMGILIALLVFFTFQLGGQRRRLAEIEAQRAEHQAAVQQVRAWQQAQAAFQPRLELLRQVHQTDRAWRQLLEDLRGLTPEGLWWTRFEVKPSQEQAGPEPKETHIELTLEGTAREYAAVAAFMQSLIRSAWLSEITLETSQEARIGQQFVTSFRLQGVVGGKGSAGPPTAAPAPGTKEM